MKFAIGMLTFHVDGQGYVEKTFSAVQLESSNKNLISTCYTKNIDREY